LGGGERRFADDGERGENLALELREAGELFSQGIIVGTPFRRLSRS